MPARSMDQDSARPHWPRAPATGLDRAGFRKQIKRIEALNRRLHGFTVLTGAEVDILPDGSLDLDDETLAELDVAVASVHSEFDLPQARQTERILKAISHGSVDILGHPAGRLIGRRAPMTLDLERIIRAAVDHGVMLELNAQPERLDLEDTAARSAHELGARLVISTDAHATAELRFMHCGVEQARRAWAEKRNIANTGSLEDLMGLLHARR